MALLPLDAAPAADPRLGGGGVGGGGPCQKTRASRCCCCREALPSDRLVLFLEGCEDRPWLDEGPDVVVVWDEPGKFRESKREDIATSTTREGREDAMSALKGGREGIKWKCWLVVVVVIVLGQCRLW